MGNRVYNDLEEDEFYMLIPGTLLKTLSEEVQNIATANTKLSERYLEQRNAMEFMLQ
jgi:hypothetical protein